MKKLSGYDGIEPFKYGWVGWIGSALTVLAVILLILVLVLSADAKESYPEITSIYWSDGDSGRINGSLKFRLANIDAPETRSMKQRGGAKCEAERKLGYEAKAYIVELTKSSKLLITKDYGYDRYKRLVIDLAVDNVDVGDAGVKSGHLKAWPHKKGRKMRAKPDWCE